MTTTTEFTNLRLRLAIRKVMLNQAERRFYKNMLLTKFAWATREQVGRVINEYLAEGVLSEEKSKLGKTILTWHEEAI